MIELTDTRCVPGGVDGRLLAGVAKVDITPDDLTNLNPVGGGFVRVHDPLHLRALVLKSRGVTLALLALDVIEVGDTDEIRRRIEAETGIPYGNIVITGSHTHNAPRVGLVSPGALALATRPAFELFTDHVWKAALSALAAALRSLQPVRYGFDTGFVDANVNRDEFRCGKWVLGRSPDGPSDKTLRVLKFDQEDGRPLAVLMNYAVHSTVAFGVPELSADLAGAAASHVECVYGGETVALWLPGSLGDQNPRISPLEETAYGAEAPQLAWDAVQAQGTMIGAEAVRIVNTMVRGSAEVTLASSTLTFTCPTQPSIDDRDDTTSRAGTVDLVLTLLLIGDTALCCVGGEVVSEVAERIQAACPSTTTVVVSLANNRIGYLTTDEAYQRGTFESLRNPTVQGHVERHLLEGFDRLIRETLPQAPA